MSVRPSIFRVYVALACVSCVRDQPAADKDAAIASASPAPTPPPPSAAPPAPAVPSAIPASAVAYDDKSDLPADAGDARCKGAPPPNAKHESVKLEMFANPPGIEIVIPSLGVRQRVWPGAASPNECHASLAAGGSALRFHCSEEASAIDGKVYSRRSDIALGRATTTGTNHTKFIMPCESTPKLEPIVCPKECKKTGDQCACGTPKK